MEINRCQLHLPKLIDRENLIGPFLVVFHTNVVFRLMALPQCAENLICSIAIGCLLVYEFCPMYAISFLVEKSVIPAAGQWVGARRTSLELCDGPCRPV